MTASPSLWLSLQDEDDEAPAALEAAVVATVSDAVADAVAFASLLSAISARLREVLAIDWVAGDFKVQGIVDMMERGDMEAVNAGAEAIQARVAEVMEARGIRPAPPRPAPATTSDSGLAGEVTRLHIRL